LLFASVFLFLELFKKINSIKKIMKKNQLLILFSGLSMASFAQTITVCDNSTREPLTNVVIMDKNNIQVKTDARGKADVSGLSKTDSVFIYQFGYTTKKLLLGTDQTVELSAKSVNLDEIILSANRKSEHKIDVPYNLEVIKQKDIEFSNPQRVAI
jgi:hemoglobin/transferrin/lactoferrin receptor protein